MQEPQVLASGPPVWRDRLNGPGHRDSLPHLESWGLGSPCVALLGPGRGIMESPRASRKTTQLPAGSVTPPAFQQGGLVTFSSPQCYLKVPPGAMAIGLGWWEQRVKDWNPGMCPLRGCGEGAAAPGPQFPHLSMAPLGLSL